ncbi:hypothetical protein [Propioniciclava soli]|uniref:Uncharacterized protein n=1 Tax=Propioniciclava soli TaxID=2775081 RepID=A0ABZ3C590_9ACTN|nr:hypothetical protein [Propioniciclava soli]
MSFLNDVTRSLALLGLATAPATAGNYQMMRDLLEGNEDAEI